MKRVFLIVLDSCGIGGAMDANDYGDEGANTFLHAYQAGHMAMPNLEAMGMYKLVGIKSRDPIAYYARLVEKSKGKDSLTGHLEMMGIITKQPLQTFPNGFPSSLIDELSRRTKHPIIGNKVDSGTDIIDELGVEAMKKGAFIIYTSADSVLQIAAHKDIIPLKELYHASEIARALTLKENRVGRIIARPFIGKPGAFTRTNERRDYALSPDAKTVLVELKEQGYDVIGLGKINDLFNNDGLTENIKTTNNQDALNKLLTIIKKQAFNGLCFVNLNDFDTLDGHRREPMKYAFDLVAFNDALLNIIRNLKADDYLMITADHGNDPTYKGTDHTRENVPLLIYNHNLIAPKDLGVGEMSDIGATISELFNLPIINGTSFLSRIKCK